jgi:hypothetical protein
VSRQLPDLTNPNDPIHEFMKKHSAQILKPRMVTGAKVFYARVCSTVMIQPILRLMMKM